MNVEQLASHQERAKINDEAWQAARGRAHRDTAPDSSTELDVQKPRRIEGATPGSKDEAGGAPKGTVLIECKQPAPRTESPVLPNTALR